MSHWITRPLPSDAKASYCLGLPLEWVKWLQGPAVSSYSGLTLRSCCGGTWVCASSFFCTCTNRLAANTRPWHSGSSYPAVELFLSVSCQLATDPTIQDAAGPENLHLQWTLWLIALHTWAVLHREWFMCPALATSTNHSSGRCFGNVLPFTIIFFTAPLSDVLSLLSRAFRRKYTLQIQFMLWARPAYSCDLSPRW